MSALILSILCQRKFGLNYRIYSFIRSDWSARGHSLQTIIIYFLLNYFSVIVVFAYSLATAGVPLGIRVNTQLHIPPVETFIHIPPVENCLIHIPLFENRLIHIPPIKNRCCIAFTQSSFYIFLYYLKNISNTYGSI